MDTILKSQAIEGCSLAAYARRLRERTMADYSSTFRKLQSHLGTDPPVAEITAGQIRSFLVAQRHLSNKTVLNYRTGPSVPRKGSVPAPSTKRPQRASRAIPMRPSLPSSRLSVSHFHACRKPIQDEQPEQ